MRFIRTRLTLALTALMVVVWSGVAFGTDGDPVTAGQNTTATSSTVLTTTQSSGNGFLVVMSGASTGTALKGQNNGSGSGISGITTNPNGFGNISQNSAASHGTGAAGAFGGGQNDGVRGTTAQADSYGVVGKNNSDGSGVFGQSSGDGNGVFGKTGSPIASGVYGENVGGGYGVAGRSSGGNGVGVGVYGVALGGPNVHGVAAVSSGNGGAIVATNVGPGPALELITFGGSPPMIVDSSAKVDNLNADRLDGLDSSQIVTGDRVIANRLTGASPGQVLLNIPSMGRLKVAACDGINGQLVFDTGGTGKVDYMHSAMYSSSTEVLTDISTSISTGSSSRAALTMNIARDTGAATKIVTIWVSWQANGCRFQAQAIQSPQL